MYDLSHINQFRSHLTSHRGREAQVDASLEFLRKLEPYTAAHSARVGEIARVIATALGLSEREVLLIEASGRLHDIGKTHISLDYLNKPSALSEAEYREVQRHPEFGAHMIHCSPLLLDLIPGVLYHHERYDGAGYPFGLRGDEIPLSARVIAVADTYDAMTSDRVYRRALTHREAIAELKAHSGSQFDAHVIEAALSARLEDITPLIS